MPCPLFLPERPAGEYHCGHCAAEPLIEISRDKLRALCNRGYARTSCAAAAAIEADAAQLLIQADRESLIEVSWSLERDHHPLAVGLLTITPGQTVTQPLEQQAAVLVTAYLEQKT